MRAGRGGGGGSSLETEGCQWRLWSTGQQRGRSIPETRVAPKPRSVARSAGTPPGISALKVCTKCIPQQQPLGSVGGERPGGFRGRCRAHRTVAYRKHACLPRHGSWVRNPADRSLGVHHSGRHGGWFYLRLGDTCQLNPVPAEGREGDLTYPEELWLRWTDGTMCAAAPPRDTC